MSKTWYEKTTFQPSRIATENAGRWFRPLPSAIASALHVTEPLNGSNGRWHETVQDVADVLQANVPNFNRAEFAQEAKGSDDSAFWLSVWQDDGGHCWDSDVTTPAENAAWNYLKTGIPPAIAAKEKDSTFSHLIEVLKSDVRTSVKNYSFLLWLPPCCGLAVVYLLTAIETLGFAVSRIFGGAR